MQHALKRSMILPFLCISFIIIPSAFSLTPFFFDTMAFSVDEDDDGGDDYILAKFDIDLDEEVTANITVTAKLYNSANKVIDTKTQTYQIIGELPGYDELRLIPVPNMADTYSIHLAIANYPETSDIMGISYNPEPGSQPIPYFANIIINSMPDSIIVDLDVNVV
jgi:hypothetical protein